MTTQSPVRHSVPVRPLMFLFAFVAAIAVGVVAVRWDRGDSAGTASTNVSTALAPSFAPAPLSPAESAAESAKQHENWTTAEFGPLSMTPELDDFIASAIAEHDNAITATVGSATLEASVPSATRPTYEEELAVALAQHDADFPALAASSSPYIMDR